MSKLRRFLLWVIMPGELYFALVRLAQSPDEDSEGERFERESRRMDAISKLNFYGLNEFIPRRMETALATEAKEVDEGCWSPSVAGSVAGSDRLTRR